MTHKFFKLLARKLCGHDRFARKARTALANKQIPLAISIIKSGKSRFPRSNTFRILEARCSLLNADVDAAAKAIEHVSSGLECSSDLVELGDCYWQLGRHAESIDSYQGVLRTGSATQQQQTAATLVVCHLKLNQCDEALDAAVQCVRLGGCHQHPIIDQLGERCSQQALSTAIEQLQSIRTPNPSHENHRQLILATFARSLSRWPFACACIRQATKAAVAATRPDLEWDDTQPALRPSVIVIGAMKAGSSALFNCLVQHPKFVTPQSKEVHFFDDSSLPDEYYFEQFARIAPHQSAGLITGEASPGYYARPVVSKVKALLPNTKLVFIKRNPVDRAISHFFHNRKVCYEDRAIEKLVRGREEILELTKLSMKDFDAILPKIHSGEIPAINRFLLLGCYDLFLRSWKAAFENQLLTLELETFSKNRQAEMNKVFDFVGIDQHCVDLPTDINAGRYDSQASSLRRVRDQLTEFYLAVEAELESA